MLKTKLINKTNKKRKKMFAKIFVRIKIINLFLRNCLKHYPQTLVEKLLITCGKNNFYLMLLNMWIITHIYPQYYPYIFYYGHNVSTWFSTVSTIPTTTTTKIIILLL